MDADHLDYQFDTVEVRSGAFEVWKAGAKLSLEPKSIRLLIYLIEHCDRAVSKDEIFTAIWTNTAVTDNALTRVIAQLRRELGDDARQPRYIQTVPTLGYRFIAPVTAAGSIEPAFVPEAAAVVPSVVPPRRYWMAYAAIFFFAVTAAFLTFYSRATAAWPARVQTLGNAQFTTSGGLDMSPSFSPDGRALAYSSDRSGRFEVCVRQVVAGVERQLTSDGAQNIQPAWSPDGKSLAFHSVAKGGIWIMPAQGGPARQVSSFGSQPAWSPDSSRVAFRSEDVFSISANDLFTPTPSYLLTVSAAGGAAVPLTKEGAPEGRHLSPSWRPDGNRILFSVQTGRSAELWTIQSDGTHPLLVTSLDSNVYISPVFGPRGESVFYGAVSRTHDFGIWKLRLTASGGADGEPMEVTRTGTAIPRDLALSADGKHLAYTSSVPASSLWTLPLQGTSMEPKALYKDVVFRTSSPVFSADGSKITFFARVFGGRGDIWIMNADGSGAAPVTTSRSINMMPSFTPDGGSVVYTRNTDTGVQLWQTNLADRAEKPLLNGRRVMGWARLSPDGKELAYHTMKNGVINIWIMPLASGEPRQITHDSEGAGFPAWSSDGRSISYELFRGKNTYLCTMDRNGNQQAQLNSDPGHSWPFSWSPDNRKILFAGFREGTWNVWSLDRETRKQERLTNYSSLATYARYPAWSPDGKQIVFEYSATKGNIYLMDLQ